MFCCAGLFSICRSPLEQVRCIASNAGEGKLAAHLFCAESYNTAWDAAFQPYPIFITAGARRTSFPFLVAQSRIDHQGKEFVVAEVTLPSNFNTNLLMMFRWFHIIAGIAWVGLLYFFNLVNTAFMKELDWPPGARFCRLCYHAQ